MRRTTSARPRNCESDGWSNQGPLKVMEVDHSLHQVIHESLKRHIIREYCLCRLRGTTIRAGGVGCRGIEFGE